MKLYHTIPDGDLFTNPVVTIGNFDGVHLGHRKIFSVLEQTAKRVNGEAVVITFSSHPRKVLNPNISTHVLTTTDEKVNAIFRLGISNIVLLNFTAEMASMDAQDFYNDILIRKLDVKEIVIGYDHTFGRDREGNYDFLSRQSLKTGISVTRVGEMLIHDRPVSSTWIRHRIEEGDISTAAMLLGRNYSVSGTVISGDGRGKDLGFPTANILPSDTDKLIPCDGVYAVKVEMNKSITRYGMLNIGNNPTFSGRERSIEVHIFDFNEKIYGTEITIEFLDRIRDVKKFPSKEDLIARMRRDEITAREIIREKIDEQGG